MKRRIIEIDTEKCNGCGLCASACHEGAIGMVEGKAVLLRENYCDGLGDCLPVCPTGAIAFTQREAPAYDAAGITAAQEAGKASQEPLPCGCPGSHAKTIVPSAQAPSPLTAEEPSALGQWPVQIKLVPVNAPYFNGARLLIAADCTAYAYAGFHKKFIQGKITLIGCPKLDQGDYSEKLSAILRENEINSVTVIRMEVPCCGGLEQSVKTALQACGKMIPWSVATVTTDGRLLEE